MKLIDEKKLWAELEKITTLTPEQVERLDIEEQDSSKEVQKTAKDIRFIIKKLLSKHLKDLPEKKTLHIKGRDIPNQHLGYNRCLEDIEKL